MQCYLPHVCKAHLLSNVVYIMHTECFTMWTRCEKIKLSFNWLHDFFEKGRVFSFLFLIEQSLFMLT